MRRIIIDGETIFEYCPIEIGYNSKYGLQWMTYKKHTKHYIKNFNTLRETLRRLGSVTFKLGKWKNYPIIVINNTFFFLKGELRGKNSFEISSLVDSVYAYSYSNNLKDWYNVITMNKGWLCNPGHIGKDGHHYIHNDVINHNHFDITRYYTAIEALLKPEVVDICFIGESTDENTPEINYSRSYTERKDDRVILFKKKIVEETILEFISDKLANHKYEDKMRIPAISVHQFR